MNLRSNGTDGIEPNEQQTHLDGGTNLTANNPRSRDNQYCQPGVLDSSLVRDRLLSDPRLQTALLEREAVWSTSMFIKAAREAAGKSQADLGRDLGVSQARIAFLESANSKRGPTLALLMRVAHACGHRLSLSLS